MNDNATQVLLDRYQNGDQNVLNDLLEIHRDRLRRMVSARLNPKLRKRIDESDVLQDAMLNASKHIGEYFLKEEMPFFVWLSWLTDQQIKQCHRFHLATQKRDVYREEQWFANGSHSFSEVLVDQLLHSTPSVIMLRNEMVAVMADVLQKLKPNDREILCMRHFEQMTNQEVAAVLRVTESSASTRYVRALSKLRRALDKIPAFLDSQWRT